MMLRRPRSFALPIATVLLLALAGWAQAVDVSTSSGPASAPVQFSRKDLAGQEVSVPRPNQITMLVFIMAGQDRSISAMKQAHELLAQTPASGVQAIAILSGDGAAAAPPMVKAAGWTGPVVADPQYDLSGAAQVRVWPTTLLVSASGHPVAHIAGLPMSYATDLAARLDFARGKITQAEMDKRLADHETVASSPQAIVERHIQVAASLINNGDVAAAKEELEKALKVEPESPHVLVMLARAELAADEPTQALKVINRIDDKAVAPWQKPALRGRALVALGQWEEALPALQEGARLNPDPAEVYYLLGRVYQHRGDTAQALEAYRAAYEHTTEAQFLSDKEKADKR